MTPGLPSPRLRQWLSVRNIGALYVLLLICVVFALWVPETFLTWQTVKIIANDHAVTALLALSLIVPLAAGVYDLSIGYSMGLAAIVVAWLMAHTGVGVSTAIALAMLSALAVGLVNAVVVVVIGIDSFIATLATGALVEGMIIAISGNVEILPRTGALSSISNWNVALVSLPVFITLAIAVLLWLFLEHSETGRYVYATGFGSEAARLSGVRIDAIRFGSLLISSGIAGIAGVLVTGRVGVGSPTIGPPYLLPAFAAAFLGATQLKPGRFTAWGTLLAVALLGTVTVGLSLASVPAWVPFFFNGFALIAAVGLARTSRN
jgi:ribose transport system permease protein